VSETSRSNVARQETCQWLGRVERPKLLRLAFSTAALRRLDAIPG